MSEPPRQREGDLPAAPAQRDRAAGTPAQPAGPVPVPRVYVEPWPSGGWVIRMAGHPVPVSRHDTEEEAEQRAEAYRRGLARDA